MPGRIREGRHMARRHASSRSKKEGEASSQTKPLRPLLFVVLCTLSRSRAARKQTRSKSNTHARVHNLQFAFFSFSEKEPLYPRQRYRSKQSEPFVPCAKAQTSQPKSRNKDRSIHAPAVTVGAAAAADEPLPPAALCSRGRRRVWSPECTCS